VAAKAPRGAASVSNIRDYVPNMITDVTASAGTPLGTGKHDMGKPSGIPAFVTADVNTLNAAANSNTRRHRWLLLAGGT
jgi:hypothetical protein